VLATANTFSPNVSGGAHFTERQIQEIEDWINALPRKILDGLSAEEKIELHFKENAS
jgi:IS30 family transposase